MARRRTGGTIAGLAAAILLAGCSAATDDSATTLAAELANSSADSFVRETLAAPLATDPDLTGQANIYAVRSGERLPGNAIPRPMEADDDALLPSSADRKPLAAPEAEAAAPCPDCGPDGPATLGAVAREHARRSTAACRDARLTYGLQWAGGLPPPFAPVPALALLDAAGADAPECRLRAASLVTATPVQAVVDFYYGKARSAGFRIRHQRLEGRAVLIGARNRDRTSFLMIAGGAQRDGTHVDLVVTQQR